MTRRLRLPRARPVAAVSAAVAAVLVVVLTRHGALIGGDSATYLRSAEWFRSDPGLLLDPPTNTDLSVRDLFPPGYAVALAVTDGWLSPRWLGVLLSAITAGLVASLVDRFAGRRAAIAVVALLVVARGWLLVLFGFVMSDGLHVAVSVVAVAALVPALDDATDDRRRRRSVLWASLAGSAAFLTRYSGLGVALGIAASALWLLPAERQRRRWLAAASAAIGVAPMALWRLVNMLTGPGEERTFGFRDLDGEQWDLVDTMARTYLPRQVVSSTTLVRIVGVPILLLIAAWSVGVVRIGARRDATTRDRVAASLLLVAWGHHLTLLLARLFSDRNVTFGGRYALAWWTFVLVAAALDVRRRTVATPNPAGVRRAGLAVVALLLVGGIPGFVRTVQRPLAAWWNAAQSPPSTVIEALRRDVDADALVVTNREDAVWFATGRETRRLPRRIDLYSGEPNPRFAAELEEVRREVAAGRAVLVVFRRDTSGFPTDVVLAGTATTYSDEEGRIIERSS